MNETTNGAQELLNFVNNFYDENKRFPKLEELPVKKRTVVYHFGSFETLLRIARLGEDERPKSKYKRYCRHCGALLPRQYWFFCPPKEHNGENNKGCEELYAEKHSHVVTEKEAKRLVEEIGLETEDFNGRKRRPRRHLWHKCKGCEHKCKIYLPKNQEEPKAKVICKTNPEYEELNEQLTR